MPMSRFDPPDIIVKERIPPKMIMARRNDNPRVRVVRWEKVMASKKAIRATPFLKFTLQRNYPCITAI
jgi:hypothetical protein